jgi:putative addiction module antidote
MMPATTKIIAIGNSAGIILPKETLARLNLQKGDTRTLTETQAGLRISPCDEEFCAKMEVADRFIRRYRDAFNGYSVTASKEKACLTFLGLAAGEMTEAELAVRFTKHTAAQ